MIPTKVSNVYVCSLASGSNGNVYYIEYDGEAILVDVGISYKKLKNRAMTRQVDLSKVRAAIISHEHSDHVYGLAAFCHHQDVRAYMTRGTFDAMKPKYRPDPSVVGILRVNDSSKVGKFTVHCFAKPHDVKEPCSFRIEVAGISIGVFTDIGAPCDGLKEHLAKCHMAFMESNYDESMLQANRKYTDFLKRRIVSGHGHLSNKESAAIVSEVNSQTLHTLFLSHISEENNSPEVAMEAFASLTDKYRIEVMSRVEASQIWHVSATESTVVPQKILIPARLDRVPITI